MEKAKGKRQKAKGKRAMMRKAVTAYLLLAMFCFSTFAQDTGRKSREEAAREVDKASNLADERRAVEPSIDSPADEAAVQAQINSVYQTFYKSYRLGAGDVIAIHVERHPDDSVEKVAVSPLGQVYYPLLGNVNVAGKSLDQLQSLLTTSVSEFIREPKLTVTLLESNNAKYGVLGDVREPGVKIMTRPMRVFDAVTAAGGILDTGNAAKVTILRQDDFGNVQTVKVNVKKMMQGKASAEENFFIQRGDTLIVHGNLFKTIGKFSSVVGLTGFVSFLIGSRR